jgi:hypothetical protein
VRTPAAKPQQWFTLRPWLFDVTLAAWLLRAAPRPARPLPVEPWARAYGLLPAPGGGPHTVSLIGLGPHFDPEYAMGTDLDEPVIIASVTIGGSMAALPMPAQAATALGARAAEGYGAAGCQGTCRIQPVQCGCGCMISAICPWYPTAFSRDRHSQYRASIPASHHW